jgi:hypothetical protein
VQAITTEALKGSRTEMPATRKHRTRISDCPGAPAKYVVEAIGTFLLVFIHRRRRGGQPAVGHVSGAHYNPAVTLAVLVRRRIGLPDAGDYVFTFEDGRSPHPDSIRQRFDRLAAGLSRIIFHDLRRSYATGALKAGISAKVVSQRIGHANVGFFLQIYAHVLGTDDRDAAEQAAAFLIFDPWDLGKGETGNGMIKGS